MLDHAGQKDQGAEERGGPAYPHDFLASALRTGQDSGVTGLLDSDNKTDGSGWAKLHLQDTCILTAQCMLEVFAPILTYSCKP